VAGKTVRPYGTWPSPIQPETIGRGIRLNDVQWTSDGKHLVWLEERSGQGVLVCREGDDAPRDITEIHNVRGTVGYGGGDFCTGRDFTLFAEKNGRLYRAGIEGGEPTAITPEFGQAAAPALSLDGRRILFVHSCERKDRIALVDSLGERWPEILVEGADFYMQPVWHPAGDRVAWIEWNHPQMPWDGTILKTASIHPKRAEIEDIKTIAGDSDTPVLQPAFSPDGHWLAYLVSLPEGDRLMLSDVQTGKNRSLVEGGILAGPAWVQGVRLFGWAADGKSIYFLQNEKGFGSLWKVDLDGGKVRKAGVDSYGWISQIAVSPKEDSIAFIGSSPDFPERVVVLSGGKPRVQKHSGAERIPPGGLSHPDPIAWKAEDGSDVYGLFYPPHNSRFESSGLPPAVVHVHGGPTGQQRAAYSAEAAFLTSRGFAFLSVNYRGSTGYGRAYMLALRERWGDLDVADALSGARAVCKKGLADPSRLVILGGSAGGYTVLNVLIRHPGFFRAGVCLYGVSDLFALAAETHKFEERYLDSMVGSLPEAAAKYRDWSPIFHAESIRDPLAVFQGADDVVVPPNQTERIVQELQRRQVPCLYKVFPGEGHGWRKSETIVAYYTELQRFLERYVL
jgi:dipeptidyl aminopeptidase/acylaminoacyl peptidase